MGIKPITIPLELQLRDTEAVISALEEPAAPRMREFLLKVLRTARDRLDQRDMENEAFRQLLDGLDTEAKP